MGSREDDEEERVVEEVDEAGLRFAYVVNTLMRARFSARRSEEYSFLKCLNENDWK